MNRTIACRSAGDTQEYTPCITMQSIIGRSRSGNSSNPSSNTSTFDSPASRARSRA